MVWVWNISHFYEPLYSVNLLWICVVANYPGFKPCHPWSLYFENVTKPCVVALLGYDVALCTILYSSTPHCNPKELQYKFHCGESHGSPKKKNIILSCFVGLTPVFISCCVWDHVLYESCRFLLPNLQPMCIVGTQFLNSGILMSLTGHTWRPLQNFFFNVKLCYTISISHEMPIYYIILSSFHTFTFFHTGSTTP